MTNTVEKSMMHHVIHKYILKAICKSPLHIGSTEGGKGEVLIHPVDGKPFIQSSSIAGVLRNAAEKVDPAKTRILFGNSDSDENSASKVKLSDGDFVLSTVKMELRPRVAIDPASGTANKKTKSGSDINVGQKYDTEYIAEGACFECSIYLYETEQSLNEVLLRVFAQLNAEKLQFGGMKTNGNGFVGIENLYHKKFDLLVEDDRNSWAKEEALELSAYKQITNELEKEDDANWEYKILVNAKTEGDLLVKSIAVTEFGENAPDAQNIQNANKDYIVPGSSLKGVLRNRITYIAGKLSCKHLLGSIFGTTGRGQVSGTPGHLFVKDTIVGDRAENDGVKLQHRIRIDKFTGGVMTGQGALFSEKNVAGRMLMEIFIDDFEASKAAAGLLVLALRDLAAGQVSIGSGYNIGKGFVCVDSIDIKHKDKSARISFTEKGNIIQDKDHVISDALKALSGESGKEG